MPREPESEPLRRVSLNLFEADVLALEAEHGVGWTGHVRELVRKNRKIKVTVEDFLKSQGYNQ